MKLPVIQQGAVQSLGRNNLGAVSQLASATAGVAQSEGQLLNQIGTVAMQEKTRRDTAAREALKQGLRIEKEFTKREDNYAYTSALTSSQLEIDEFEEKFLAKEYYTTEEVEGLPEGSVRRTTTGSADDGAQVEVDRNDIPAYQVYPYLLKNKLEGVIKQKAESITNPQLREEYLNQSRKVASAKLLKATVNAEKQQQVYLKQVATDDSLQSAIKGKLGAAEMIIKNADFSPQAEKELLRNRRQVFEWGQDDAIINTGNLNAMSARLEALQAKSYGKGKGDYFDSGKASGQFNQEAAIRRFKSAVKTTRGKLSNAEKIRIQEEIRHRANGGDGGFTYKGESFENNIRNNPNLSVNDKNTLVEKGKIAQMTGDVTNLTRTTTREEDKQILENKFNAIKEGPASLNDDNVAAYKAAGQVMTEKEQMLTADATTYLNQTNDVLAGMYKEMTTEAVLSDPELFKNKRREYHIASRAEQKRLGLADEEVNFISRQEVDMFKQASSKLGREPNAVAGLMSQLQQLQSMAQDEWPAYYTQLIREGAIQPEHVMASILKDPSMQIQYVDAVNNQAEIEKQEYYKSNIKDVRAAVFNSLVDLRGTLLTPGALPNVKEGMSINTQMDAFENGLVQMTMTQVALTGKWDESAIKKTSQAIIDSNWRIVDQVRIPLTKTKTGGKSENKYDVDAIERGLSKYDNFKALVNVSPDLKFASVVNDRISYDDDQEVLRDDFITFASPSTNANETGVVFKYSTGNPVLVVRDGKTVPLTITFEQLEEWGNITYKSQADYRKNMRMEIK